MVKPLSDRVLILPNPAEEKTAGGLYIPDTAKEKPLAGKVVAVGPGTKDITMEVKEGDEVLYGKYSGQELTIDGVVGVMTWDALDKAVSQINEKPSEKIYSVIIRNLDKTQAEAIANNYPGAEIVEG